ncbi:hypothetical protein BH11CYA1_BH11CYA1_22760 [soil metagenome]
MRNFWRLTAFSLLTIATVSACNKPTTAALGKWGYINKSGIFIVKPQFDEASEFTKDGAIVKQEKRLMRLQADPPGESTAPVGASDKAELAPLPTLECAEAGVKKYKIMDGTAVVFDPSTSAELPEKFGDSGLICARFDNQYAFIDKSGSLGIPRLFAEAKPFVAGRAAVKENGKWGFINKRGVFVIPPKYLDAGTFFSGLAPVKVVTEEAAK